MKLKLTLEELHQIFDALDIADEFFYANLADEDPLSPQEQQAFESAFAKVAYAIQTYNT